jgi:hypothetical protein
MGELNDGQLMARRLEWGDAQSMAGEAIEFFPEEGGAPVALAVLEASERHLAPHMRQFALVFRGPPQPVYPQRTYHFRHARLGDYAFFITPIGASKAGVDYEACFSHAP